MDTIDSEAQHMLFCMYAVLAGNSVLIYDHMATLPDEIASIWRRPKALSAMLFLLNRYVALLGNISSLVIDFMPLSDESCSKYTIYRQLAFIFQAFIVCIIMMFRTYALYGGNKRLLTWMTIILFALAGAAAAGTIGQYSGDTSILPGVGCNETYTSAIAARIGLSWICKIRGLLRLSLVTRRNIIDIIFHDGAMYFGAMALSNIPNILTYYSGSVTTRASLATFTSCMSVTLISRLMLNLHKSIDAGIFSTPALDDGLSLAVLTTGVNVQSAISSHHW